MNFNSEFCSVSYNEKDKVVFLSWKKFACGDNYRKPTLFALELMREYPESRLVVDARNGFEDEESDAKWGISVLIPEMAKTTCKLVCFILNEVNEIEEEMDMWTKEFGRFFAVIKATDYEDAIQKMSRMLLVNVRYQIRKGMRDEFYHKVKGQNIITASKEEAGNYQYEYFYPVDTEDIIFLSEIWTNETVQKQHALTEQYQKLTILKQQYVESVTIEKYWITVVS